MTGIPATGDHSPVPFLLVQLDAYEHRLGGPHPSVDAARAVIYAYVDAIAVKDRIEQKASRAPLSTGEITEWRDACSTIGYHEFMLRILVSQHTNAPGYRREWKLA